MSKNVYVVGFGKAVLGMAAILESKIQEHIIDGIISVPIGMSAAYETESNRSSHSTYIWRWFSFCYQLQKPPLTLSEKQKVISLLTSKGANIEELNAVRKQLSTLKGGNLALLAKPAKVISLILSDIIGDPIGMIASGPTVQNSDSPSLALSIIEKYDIVNQLPKSAMQILKNASNNNEIKENFSHVNNFIIGNNETALLAASHTANDLNYQSIILSNKLKGIASTTGKNLISLVTAVMQNKVQLCGEIIKKLELPSYSKDILLNNLLQDQKKKYLFAFGGETTVEVHGSGIGGRNQELSLAAALELHVQKHCNIVLLSAGTDGIDGPTCAAGAIASTSLMEEALKKGLDPHSFLLNNNSYTFYSQVNDGQYLIKTGHTGTNVMDIIVILITV
ncbi:glycerate kinase [Caerostris extrusa]|uniref:Glycerate kinase n=1 Tax=Caerostris extrusa TaxID=172846 RepID=A0AAV4UT14_CAEEX|nr:glycerate kinase [Caerostris extrusa]